MYVMSIKQHRSVIKAMVCWETCNIWFSELGLRCEAESCFVEFTSLRSVNIPTMADFEQSISCELAQRIPENLIISSQELA